MKRRSNMRVLLLIGLVAVGNAADCADNGTFADTVDGETATVACAAGYTGDRTSLCTDTEFGAENVDNCADILECDTNPCAAEATCAEQVGDVDTANACTCGAGYTGDGLTCTDILECDATPCAAEATCAEQVGDVDTANACTCGAGYTGDGLTCADILECDATPCAAEATCVEQVGDADTANACTCGDGYTGDGLTCTGVDCVAIAVDNGAGASSDSGATVFGGATDTSVACDAAFQDGGANAVVTCGNDGTATITTACTAPVVAENECNCTDGTGTTGADCETDATDDCASCDAQFEIVGGATAAAGDECVATVCTCTGGAAATDTCLASGEKCASCTAFQQWVAEVLPVEAAEEDDAATTDIDETVEIEAQDEVPGIAGFHAVDDTCVADVCVCSDPAVNNADDALTNVANSGTEDVPVWANHWAAGMQTAATGMWCTGNGNDVCVADPTMCASDHACGADWTIMTDLSAACATDTCTDAECCTEDASASASVEEEEKATHECTCADDAADTCAEAVKEDTVVDEATCTAVDGGAWTKLAKAESEEDESSAAAVSAVVALIALLL